MSPDLAAGRCLSVLITDDYPDAAESLACLVRLWGHDVTVAQGGPAALSAAATSPPDVVLLEPRLRGANGWDVARQLQHVDPRPLVIAVTTGGRDEDVRRSAAAGMSVHLVKPIDPDVLADLMERLGWDHDPRGGTGPGRRVLRGTETAPSA